MTQQALKRVQKELTRFPQDGSIGLTVNNDNDILKLTGLILGPDGTPYAGGVFLFSFDVPLTYPYNPPVVKILTTNGGTTRFNPNFYANGKVCVTVLNTFGKNEWTVAYSLEKVLDTIQSMMTEDPFHNEPGFERCTRPQTQKRSPNGEAPIPSPTSTHECELCEAKVIHEVMRIAVCQPVASILRAAKLEMNAGRTTPDSSEEEDKSGATTAAAPAQKTGGGGSGVAALAGKVLVKALSPIKTGLVAVGAVSSAVLPPPVTPPAPAASASSAAGGGKAQKRNGGHKRGASGSAVIGPVVPEVFHRRIIDYFVKRAPALIKQCQGMIDAGWEGKAFRTFRWEHPGNTMEGSFEFVAIRDELMMLQKCCEAHAALWRNNDASSENPDQAPTETTATNQPPARKDSDDVVVID